MFVVSSRSKRVLESGRWIILEDDPENAVSKSDSIPKTFLDVVSDPLLILIHGYSNTEKQTFDRYREQIGTEATPGLLPRNGFTGTIVGYDWPSFDIPSTTALHGYESDLNAARNTGAPALIRFVDSLSAALKKKKVRINLMAHSMGNLVVRTMLLANPNFAKKIDNIISFGADILSSDLQLPDLKKAADSLRGNWFVYWAQADLVLLQLSNYANIMLGNEKWGGQRVGQVGPPKADISDKVVGQEWDSPLADDIGTYYSWDLRLWRHNPSIHSAYWRDVPFLKNVCENLLRKKGTTPITINWPLPPRP
jgi:pimeloyl-ACP methyl ester carboxylesterase